MNVKCKVQRNERVIARCRNEQRELSNARSAHTYKCSKSLMQSNNNKVTYTPAAGDGTAGCLITSEFIEPLWMHARISIYVMTLYRNSLTLSSVCM